MKDIPILLLMIIALPLVIWALWYVFKTPNMLEREGHSKPLYRNNTQEAYA